MEVDSVLVSRHGDSGGPVLVTRNGNLIVAGVSSIGTGTRAKPCSKASTSTRIARFSEWIMNALGSPATPGQITDSGTAGLAGTSSGQSGTAGASGGAGGALTQSAITAGTRNDGGCSVGRPKLAVSPWRSGFVCGLGLALLLRRRRRRETGRRFKETAER